MQGVYDRRDAEAERSRKVKTRNTLEITFTDNSKITYDPDSWVELRWTENLAIIVNIHGEKIAWFPIRNIKSIVTIEEVDE